MLRFFRLIRQKLINENRFNRYLLYALGEIVLVVLGILIALQINNWNLNKIDRDHEQVILQDLQKEFIENRTELEEKEMIRDLIISCSKKLNRYINDRIIPDNKSELDSLMNFSLYVATFDPRNGVLNNLLSSGQINLVRNRKLESLLTNWKGALSELLEHEKVSYDVTLDFAGSTLFTSNFDLRRMNTFNYSNYLEREYSALDVGSQDFDYNVYFNNQFLTNYLSMQNDMAQFAKMEAVGIFKMIDEILELIESELR